MSRSVGPVLVWADSFRAMSSEQTPSNRQIWEDAFGVSRIREDDYATMSGIPLDPVYGPDDGEFPGQYPYTRGPTRRCTGRSCGRCACSPGSAPPRTPTGASRRSSKRRRRACRRRSTCRRCWARLRRPDVARRGRPVRRGRRHARRHGGPVRRDRPRRDHHLDDDQLARRPIFAMFVAQAEKPGCPAPSSAAPSRTTS